MPALFPASGKARAGRLVVTGQVISCTLLLLGIVGMLMTRLEETEELAVFTVHPLTAVVWFVLGVVGVAMSVDARRAQVYLAATGALLALWGLLCLALDGSPSDVFARDPELLALLLVGGAVSLVVALTSPVARLDRALG
ncbi:MAG TPA: DUF4383 domain-containing protein [Miltoncostaeaceae bacterium]|nr:DUF4383 domain-containing protein [Miltoncostaeaceae bacterium]